MKRKNRQKNAHTFSFHPLVLQFSGTRPSNGAGTCALVDATRDMAAVALLGLPATTTSAVISATVSSPAAIAVAVVVVPIANSSSA